MKIQRLPTLALLLLPALVAAAPSSPHFKVEPLAAGVWAVLADSGAATGNAAIVDLGDRTLVFDAFLTPEAADDLRRAARELTGRAASYVALSHWHNDHVRGAQAFDGALVLASTRTRALIVEKEAAALASEKRSVAGAIEHARARRAAETNPLRFREYDFWIGYHEAIQRSHAVLQPTRPALTFADRLILHGTTRSAELIALDGHTGGDTVLWLPEEKLAFLGDLLFVDHHPYLPDGDPAEHRAALGFVKGLGPARVLPGHGPVSGPETLDAFVAYLDGVEAAGRDLARAGATDKDALAVAVPEPYARWGFSVFYKHNVRFALRRARPAADRR